MSLLGKKWVLKNEDPTKTAYEKILENRGMDFSSEQKNFHNPFLFRDMQIAVDRINKAILNDEKIAVFGDYDVDGMSGTAILSHTLKKLGADFECFLPNRLSDGYGLSKKFIDEFLAKNVKLLITVDCGISSAAEVEYAADNGLETIITDHHTIPNIYPEKALAILHPKIDEKYPYKELTGSGVAFKLAQALLPDDYESFVDLASLGTVADLGPLTGENRLIVKRGLMALNNTKWPGLKKIIDLAELKNDSEFDTSTIGYRIAPRLNAAGRIGDPAMALNLLLEEVDHAKVDELGKALEELNSKRQDLTFSALDELENLFSGSEDLPFILIAQSPDYHVGILGLVAGRLVETFGRPAIVMQDFGDNLVASARSPEYFNITDALANFKELLISFGGHAQAAGFNLKKENLAQFTSAITEFAKEKLSKMELMPTLEIDSELALHDLKFELVEEIENLKPFGVGNRKPLFVLKNVEPHFISQVGKERDHLKFTIDGINYPLNAIAFRMGQHADTIRGHNKIDLVFQLEKNIWNGRTTLQLQVVDISLCTSRIKA